MAFVLFEKPYVRVHAPFVTIDKKGRALFNSGVTKKLSLKEGGWVSIYIDEEECKIGFVFVKEKVEHAVHLYGNTKPGRHMYVNVKAVLKKLGFKDAKVTHRITPEFDDKMMIISIDKEKFNEQEKR